MPFLTRQQIFDKAFIGLRNQGFRPAYEKGCQYLTADGLRCAWGHVNTELTRDNQGPASEFPGQYLHVNDYDFANDLQSSHDCTAVKRTSTTWPSNHATHRYNFKYQDMEGNLRKFAAYHNLTTPE